MNHTVLKTNGKEATRVLLLVQCFDLTDELLFSRHCCLLSVICPGLLASPTWARLKHVCYRNMRSFLTSN